MSEYIIMSDSSCDLPAAMAEELAIPVAPLSATVDGKDFVNTLDWRDIAPKAFFDLLREGRSAKTTAANQNRFEQVMRPILESGKDILYLGFSSALSGTVSAGKQTAEALLERYPERRIEVIDTLCASLGEGLMVYLAAQKKRLGQSLDEVAAYVRETIPHLCHWFTVDDLGHLRRGGRVSAATALVGTILQVKPVMHVDDEGRLINVSKVRGRRASIRALAAKLHETAIDPQKQTAFISHGDCLEDAQTLADLIRSESGIRDVVINHVGPVIGSHSGPGTLALFFLGEKR